MGKTKINTVAGEPAIKKGKLSYEEKRASRAKVQEQKAQSIKQTAEPETQSSISSPVKIEREVKNEEQPHAAKVSRGKKYKAAKAKIETGKTYPLSQAAKLAKETSYSKFPGSVELHLILDQERGNVNFKVELPYSTGVSKKVEVASDETVEKLKVGKIDFDVLIATPEIMPKLVPFAKLLGPRGLMPNPKNGTVVSDPKKALESFGGKNIQIRTEKDFPLTHTVVGKTNQPENEIEKNIETIFEVIGKKSIKKAVLSSTMGPSIQTLI